MRDSSASRCVEPGGVGDELGRSEVHEPVGRAHPSAEEGPRLRRRQEHALRVPAQLAHGGAASPAQQQRDDAVRRELGPAGQPAQQAVEPREHVRRRRSQQRRAAGLGEVGEDAPLLAALVRRRHDGGRPLRVRHDLEHLVGDGEVAALEHVGGRQHVVGEGRGLVAVDVDAHHEVEPAHRVGQVPAPARHRVHRVARGDEQRPDAVRMVGRDLVGERGHREGAGDPVPAPIRRPVLVERAEAQGGAQAQDVERPLRHEQPTGAVEVAADQVQRLQQPVGDRPERTHVDAGGHVERGTIGRRVRAWPARGWSRREHRSPRPRAPGSTAPPRRRPRRRRSPPPARGRGPHPARR